MIMWYVGVQYVSIKKNLLFLIRSQTNYCLGNFGITYEAPDIKCFSWNTEVSLRANSQALSHFFFHSFKLVSEIFAFASSRNVDGNMIVEVIPPVGLVQRSFHKQHSLWSPLEFCLHKELELEPLESCTFFFLSLCRSWLQHSSLLCTHRNRLSCQLWARCVFE